MGGGSVRPTLLSSLEAPGSSPPPPPSSTTLPPSTTWDTLVWDMLVWATPVWDTPVWDMPVWDTLVWATPDTLDSTRRRIKLLFKTSTVMCDEHSRCHQ